MQRLSLMNAGMPLVVISVHSFAVDEADLAACPRPAGYKGRGQAARSEEKPKDKLAN